MLNRTSSLRIPIIRMSTLLTPVCRKSNHNGLLSVYWVCHPHKVMSFKRDSRVSGGEQRGFGLTTSFGSRFLVGHLHQLELITSWPLLDLENHSWVPY